MKNLFIKKNTPTTRPGKFTIFVRTYLKGECIHGGQTTKGYLTFAEMREVMLGMERRFESDFYHITCTTYNYKGWSSFGASKGGHYVEVFAVNYA
jgi:hypothetical protein